MYSLIQMKYLLTFFIFFSTLSVNAQQTMAGLWNTGNENTVIEMLQLNGEWLGQIHSSDNPGAIIGKTIIKDLEEKGDKWVGKIFVVKRQKWATVQITPQATQLDLVVSSGFSKKSIQWAKAKK